jgi:hypothetical protein
MGLKMLAYQIDIQQEKKVWDMWLSVYPNMDKDNFIPFSEYKEKATTPRQVSKQSTQEIIEQAKRIRAKTKK